MATHNPSSQHDDYMLRHESINLGKRRHFGARRIHDEDHLGTFDDHHVAVKYKEFRIRRDPLPPVLTNSKTLEGDVQPHLATFL